MKQIWILCVDDEPDVLRAVERELQDLEDTFPVDTAESAAEALEAIARIEASGDCLGLILCDHVMPDKNGVELLIEMHASPSLQKTRKVLVTGQAGLDATIRAVNDSRLDFYIAKPWADKEIETAARTQLTEYVIRSGINPKPYMKVLDAAKLSKSIYEDGLLSDE